MKCIVSDDVVLSWPLEGPLATHIVEFARWLQDEGYALYSRRKRILLAACFSRWLETERVNSIRVSSELMVRYLRSRGRGVVVFQRECMALRQFIDFLRRRRGFFRVSRPLSSTLCRSMSSTYSTSVHWRR
jgi:hypothetical protein